MESSRAREGWEARAAGLKARRAGADGASMSGPKETLCFTCGLPISDPPRFNHLPNGRSCPACRDRLLESIPAPLPAGAKAAAKRGGPRGKARSRSRSVRPAADEG